MEKQREKFSWRKRLKSFVYAFNGMRILLLEEHNARIHLFAAIFVVAAGLFFRIEPSEWMAIFISMGGVFGMEAINSAIENLADFVTEEKQEKIRKAKDLAAAGVLFFAIAAALVGAMIFIPKIGEVCS